MAALRSVTEGAQPNTNWDDVIITGAAPHVKTGDSPNAATQNAALNASVTPLVTKDGKLRIARAITSRSLNGATPDYKTYDVADAVVSIRVRKELVSLGEDLRAKNPYSGPDVGVGLPPDKTFTPRFWKSKVMAQLLEWEGPAYNWLEQVEANPPQVVWDTAGKRVMSDVPTIAKTQFHSLGIIVRQTAA